MTLYTEYTEEGQHFIIHIKGLFNFHMMASFREAYTGLNNNVSMITVDFREAEAIDSAGLGMLLNMRKAVGLEKSKVRLTHCRNEIRQLLTSAKLDSLFEIS